MDVTINFDIKERHIFLAFFVLLVFYLFQAVFANPYSWSTTALNLIVALGVAYVTFWLLRRAMNFYDGVDDGVGINFSIATIIRYVAASALVIAGAFLLGWFISIALEYYYRLIASNIMWLLFLIIPIMTLFLTAKTILEKDENNDEPVEHKSVAGDPPTEPLEPKTGGKK